MLAQWLEENQNLELPIYVKEKEKTENEMLFV